MSTEWSAVPEPSVDSRAIAPAVFSPTRRFYWSVRRELWENRSIYIAPLAVAGVGMLAFLISLMAFPHIRHGRTAADPRVMLVMPYAHVAWLLLLTAFIVAVFYSLDALHGERRDRSILFWKSLPVSDLTTVLSKASIPLVVLPLLVFAIAVATQLLMLLLNTVALLATGQSAAMLWTLLFQMELVLLYGLIVLALWHAPLYGWLLLVSAWARRATFLWAVLPLVTIGVFERIAFHTSYFGALLKDRLWGFAAAAFDLRAEGNVPIDPHFVPLAALTLGKFLSTPGLWIGLAFAAIFLAAAVRLRRYREPV